MEVKPKILVVDDEPDFIEGFRVILTAKAYQVVIASNRTQAQDIAISEKPDMAVIGTMLPRGDAFQFYQWLKRTPPFNDMPIMVIDSPPDKRLLKGWRKDEGLQIEDDDYLVKPLAPTALMSRIEKLLNKSIRMIRVLVVDDHALIREGIRALLMSQKDIQVVGEAVNGEDALEKATKLLPDVVLMDIVMPVMNGLEATKQICMRCKQVKVLMLSQYDDERNINASAEMGAHGFISKMSASSQLLDAIRSVNRGERLMTPVTT